MSLFKQSTHKIIDSYNINFNMPNSDIYYTDIKKNTLNKNIKNYYEISYNKNAVIFQSSLLASSSYTAKKIYFFSLLHKNIDNLTNISDTDIIGELIIEHEDNNKSKLFTCFLLKKNLNSNAATIITENPDKIDDIIDFIINYGCKNCPTKLTNVKFNNILINSTSVNNKFIYYKDKKNNNIFVFLTPIDIAYNENASFISSLLDTIDLSNKSDKKEAFSDLLDKSYIKEAYTEGVAFDINASGTTNTSSTASSSKVTSEESLECELIGVGSDTIPYDEAEKNKQNKELKQNADLMRISNLFFAVMVLIIGSYVVLPFLGNLIHKINKKINKKNLDQLSIIQYYILSTFLFILYIVVIYVTAFKYYNKQNILLFFGSISITIFILGTTLLFSNINSTTLNFNGFRVIIGNFFIFLFVEILLKKYIILFISSIILIAIYLLINNKINNKNYSEELSFWCILILPISIIFALLSESSHDENNV